MKLKASLALLLPLLLVACKGEEAPPAAEQATTAKSEAAPQAAPAAADVDAIAWVNGEPVTKQMYELHLMQRSQGHPERLPPEAREQLLNELVGLTLLVQEAERRGLPQDPEVKVRLEAMRRAVLAQAVAQQVAEVDEAALRAEYENRFGDAGQQYHARHILLKDEAAAREVIKKLDAGGDFAELAKEYSTGPTGPSGGDLGWFEAEHMVPEFSAATQKLEPGSYSKEPVQTQFGYHVIKLEGVRPIPTPSFEEVRPELEATMGQQAVQQRVEDLRSKAEIRFDESVAPQEEPAAGEPASQDENGAEE